MDKKIQLPERCYGTLPSSGEIIIIARGEAGYYKTDFSSDDKEFNKKLVDEYNEKLGVTKAQAAAISAGSMFGWDCPAANPELYDENGAIMPANKEFSLEDKISLAEQEKHRAENSIVDMTYGELCKMFRAVEKTKTEHVTGYIVISEDSFTAPYSEEERTYGISSNNKAFQPDMGGYSIYGSSLDGGDRGVRLERYLAVEHGGKDGWKIERCYMKQDEINKADKIIDGKDREETR